MTRFKSPIGLKVKSIYFCSKSFSVKLLQLLKKSTVKCSVFDFDVSEDESDEYLEKSTPEVMENIFAPKGKKYSIKTQAFLVA